MTKHASFADIIEINDRFHDSALLHHAVEIELFEFLQQPRTADTLSRHYGWVPTKGVNFLKALVSLGFVEKKAETFCNTEASSHFLRKSSPKSLVPVIVHQQIQWVSWSQIGQNLATVGPIVTQQNVRLTHDDHANSNYNAAMRNLSIGNIDAFLQMDIAQDGDFVLDLAGGHGFYLAEILRRYPNTHGEVWDLPQATKFSAEALSDPSVFNRAAIRPKDLSEPGFLDGVKADLILLNNCLHYFSLQTAGEIVNECVRALNPNGRIVITAVHLEDDGVSPAAAAKFAFHMTMNATQGGLHPSTRLRELLRNAGLETHVQAGGTLGVMDVDVIWGCQNA